MISRLFQLSAPMVACVAAFGQQGSAAPPPPVFPANGPVANAPPQDDPALQAQNQGQPQQQGPYQQNQGGPYPQGGPYQAPPPAPYQGQGQSAPYSAPYPAPQGNPQPFPAHVVVKPGTWLPVRIEQVLSSDHNQTGESFYATLAEPLVINGVVVAHRGQAVTGRVTQAQKAGRTEGTSRLGLEITSITLADGEQASVHTRIIQHNGPETVGRDLAAMGQTTAIGAMIGAVASGTGKGAGIGAGIGAAAGLAGVLSTRGRPTEIYPETLLTFQLESPVEVDTTRSGAFRYADSRDYQQDRDRNFTARRPAPPPRGPVYGPVYGPGWGYGYPYYGSFGIVIGRSYGYGRGRWGRW